MFKIESYIGPLLMGYLNKYVKLNEESFKLSLWGGDAVFHNLELQYDILEHLMPLPIGFKSGQVHELKIHIPWTKLGSESVIITLNTVECILELKSDFIRKNKTDKNQSSEKSPIKSEKLSPEKQKLEKNLPPGYIKTYMYNIINNIHVKVNNLIIKFVEDDIVLSMNAKALEYYPVTEKWTRGFVGMSAGGLSVNKVIEVSDLTVCLDQMDASGHIELYQEPILYRCSVECRFFANYPSINSNSPSFIKLNIQFGQIDFNIATSQMPMIRRLVELVYALYYGVVNWDSIVGCGFSKQMIVPTTGTAVVDREVSPRRDVESPVALEGVEGAGQASWTSWAWSYVPAIFGEDESIVEEDQFGGIGSGGQSFKKIFNFSVFFQSINWRIKKSHVTKSLFGSRRSNCNKTLTHFFTVVGNNIGLNIANNGLGFCNVQLGCTEIKLLYDGNVCVCGQDFPINQDNKVNQHENEFIHIGDEGTNEEHLSDFYLTGNLFSQNESSDINFQENDTFRLNSINSQESYSSIYSQEKCLKTFPAMWFDYTYFMQIVKNNLDESQIDLTDLCNTDGIRESSQCNLYIGKSTVQINSYFVHNMKEIIKSLDTSRYLSYFCPSDDVNERHNLYYSTEEQVARIHEFVPVRRHNVCLVQLSINLHPFTESHQITDPFPIIKLKADNLKFSRVAPMYPRHLVGCVSTLHMNLLKESSELINKCYILKSFCVTGLSVSFFLPEISYTNEFSNTFHETTMLEPCDLDLNIKWLLYPESWKTTSLIVNDMNVSISNLQLKLVPSHIKTSIVIVISNYSWISVYLGYLSLNSSSSAINKRLDDLTVKLLGSRSTLVEACHKYFYKNKTYELHVSLPKFVLQTRKTFISFFIDVKVYQDDFLLYLQSPESSVMIPVLDNKLDPESSTNNKQSTIFVLSCQIPNQTRPVNCAFNLKCQIGSINFMISQPLISWFIYPLLDVDLDKYIESDIFPMFSSIPKKSSANHSSVTISDIRSVADGSSRPESPNIFFNKHPVPGHPRPININVEKPKNTVNNKMKFLSNKTGWWNIVKDSCSKYFFLLQSLDVSINMARSNIYIATLSDISSYQSELKWCGQWVEKYLQTKEDDGSIFLVKMTRLALVNSQRRDYLNESFQSETLSFQAKPTTIIDSLPWELIFHDIRIDCLHSLSSKMSVFSTISHDSILKPVSINCTLSATPKCSSPDKLETLYSVSWGVHVDITEVQPTIKQIYLAKIFNLFSNIVFKLPWSNFIKNVQYLVTGHYKIVQGSLHVAYSNTEQQSMLSKQSMSTKSTRKSKSSAENNESAINSLNKGRLISSKLETQSVDDVETKFKLSFWIQCTLSQFQLVIMNDRVDMDHNAPYVYLMLQIDDATSCIDVQEKFVEIKGKLGSILCQIGLMKNEKIVSEIPILKTRSKFLSNEELPFSYKSFDESQHVMDDMNAEDIIRHCLSIAVIRTTPNNLSKRPISTYHHFKDSESFKSYPTEFTGNFSDAINVNNKHQSYITQISSVIEPFDLYLPPFFLKQCIELSNSFVSLCNQLLQNSVKKWSLPNKLSSPISASSIKNEPYFISEDMPKFYLLIKSSRVILPRFQNENYNIYNHPEPENGCIIATWKKISIQPFSNNAISRPEINKKLNEDNQESVDSQSLGINCLDDNRQFQLDIFQCGIFLNQYNDSVTSLIPGSFCYEGNQREPLRSAEVCSTSVLHGQNPAFEWNNFSKLSSFIQNKINVENEFLPIMKPIDIQIIFAGALHESSNMGMKRQLIGGYGLEINILTNWEFSFDSCSLDFLTSIIKNITEIFHQDVEENVKDVSCKETVQSLEDLCRLKNIDSLIPCVPINILMTTRKIQILCLLSNSKELNISSSVYGLCLSISQPHAILSFRNRQNHKFEISFFDANLSVTPTHWSEKINFHDHDKPDFWFNREFFILAEMKTLISSKPGHPNIKTGVPASLLTVIFSNFYKSSLSKCVISITRHVLANFDIEDIEQLMGFTRLLSGRLKSVGHRESSLSTSSPTSLTYSLSIFIPSNISLSSELFSLNLFDHNNENKVELKFGPLNISSNLITNYIWNNLHLTTYFKSETLAVIHSFLSENNNNSQNKPRFLLYPNKISGKLVLSQYRFNSLDDFWRSWECSSEINLGAASISMEENQIVFLYQLIMKVLEIVTFSETEQVPSTNSTACEKRDKKIEIFFDELRTNKFKLITNTSCKENDHVSGSGSNLIADEGTISFSDDNDDVASMLWTYPEPRCIISLEVKPVPFVFIECNFVREDNYELLQIPCRLEYWNNSTNQYDLYQTFNLSENQTEKINNLPAVEQLSQSNIRPVVAKSWRVIFDCYARYFSSDSNIKSNAEKAMLIYLSPLVLAASLKIDSCYGSFLVQNSDIKLLVPQIEFVFHENKKVEWKNKLLEPFKSIVENYQDYSVSDHNILFKCFLTEFSLNQRNREIKEIDVLKLELFISNPFMSLQTPITVVEKLHVKYSPSEQVKEQLEIDIEACQMGLDIITLRQLYVTFEKMKSIISALLECTKESITETLKYPMILFCNNLDRRIRIHQKEDNFFKMSESTKIGGLGSGEAVILKFFSEKENNITLTNKEMNPILTNHIELLIGLYSELKGMYKWTESIELPFPNFNNSPAVAVTLGMWKLDVSSKHETSILTNSSTLFNSFNAKNLFYIHKHFIEGINKIIVIGNTIMNNSTPHFIQICFSVPSELSTGVTFTIPPLGHSIPVSQYINWKYISLSNFKNMFELSFRIVNNQPDASEYHSLSYQVNVPNLSDLSTTYQQQIMIKLKLYNTDGQIISSRILSFQFLCTLEWFRFSEGDEILLLITLSPLMIFENLMLHDVKLELSNSNVDQTLANVEDSLIIHGRGGTLKLMNLFLTESANLNASFLNDNAKLFDNPLIITENDVLKSLSKKLNFIYENKFSTSIEKERIDCVADLISQIIENSELFFESLGTHNPYSVTVTITPWILISNKTQLDLVLSFDKNVYYLESNSDFVPSKSDKPMKIGIAYANDVYWSKQFLVGKDVISQTDNSFVDVTWNFIKNDFKDEAVLQMNIVVGRHKHFVPLTLKHLFVDSVSNFEKITTKFHHLIIESSTFVSNQTDVSLNIESLWFNNNLDSNIKTDVNDGITLHRNREYFPVSKFHSINHLEDNSNTNNKFVLKINLSDNISSSNSLFNCLTMVDFNVLTSNSDSEIDVTTNFLFVKDTKKGSSKIGFRAFNVNTSVSLTTQKIFVDVFDCKFVPIKFTNWSDQTIMINEFIDVTQWNGSSILQIEPLQSVPYWPVDYQVEVNKEGCGQFTKSCIRFRVGIELEFEIDWTEYFPLTFSDLPSNIHINTISRKEYLQLLFDSDDCAKIHINIYSKSQQTPKSVSEQPNSHTQTLSISRLSFSFFERQVDMEILIESVRISIEKMICKLTNFSSNQNIIYELLADHIQIDNKLFSSGLYDFPVFLNSLKTHPGQAFMSMQIETNGFSVYSVNLLFQEELEFFVENAFLYDLLRLSSQFYNCIVPETKLSPRHSVLSMPLLNVININISPVLLRMTVHAFLKIYVSCESTSLGLPEFVISDCSLRLTTFQKRIWHHYATAVLIRCGCVLGSIELFGNPNGIVRHLSTGFTDLLSSRNIDHGLLVDFLLRILSFCRHTSGGFISSFTGIASSVSRNLDYFTLDDAHINRQSVLRRQSQTIGVMHSFFNGLSGFALSLLGAIAGIADQPLQASQEALNSNSSVSMAVIKGLGKGLIGVVTKPLSGTAELLAQTGKGLLNTTGIAINRFHSNLVHVTLSSRSEILINTTQLLFHSLTFDDRSGVDIPILLWSSIAINENQVPVYLFLTNQYLIEWYIDYPLKNRKTLYLLSNYKFSVIPHSSFKQCLKLQYIDKIVDLSYNTDYRISAFISELQYSKEVEPSRNNSRKSSMDSTDYVKFASPTGAIGYSSNFVDIDNTTLHSTEIYFYSFQCLEGILDALMFLSCQRNLLSDSII